MSFSDIFKKSFLSELYLSGISTSTIIMTLFITAIIGVYIYFIYRVTTRKAFYSKSFNISLVALAMITAAIILAVQSSVVISLGMVGALSIVRFRTAIKEPMDLVFLFWSISVGIVCGASLYDVAIIASVFVTIIILLLEYMPAVTPPMLLIISAENCDIQDELIDVIGKYAKHLRIKSRNLTKNSLDMIIELRIKDKQTELLKEINNMEGIHSVSLVSHDGEVTG